MPFAAKVLERSYNRLSKSLNVTWEKKKPFFLYSNVNDMQQSNIVAVGDGTGGVTEAFKDRFMVFNDGSRQWLDTVITHELTHVFQFHILVSGFWKSARILKTIVYPLWMMEGMAEYYSWGFDDTSGELLVRDAATSKGLIPLWKLEHFSHLKPHQVRLAYESGEKILGFLEAEYGKGLVEKMIKMFESRFESSAVLRELTGLDSFAFDRKWQEYAHNKYWDVVWRERLMDPHIYGKALTTSKNSIPEYNSSPVFSPDGKKMYFFTTRFGFPPALAAKNLETGTIKKLVAHNTRIEAIHLGNFANKSRILDISPSGDTLVFSGTKNHIDSLYFYDLVRKKVRRMKVPGFMRINQPSYSPDGKQIVFSGMKGSVTDIYVLDLKSKRVRQLTDDPQDDEMPKFSPSGDAVVYSSEIELPGDTELYQRRLYRILLADNSIERLLNIPGSARDPVFSRDGKRLLFALERNGFYDIYELELATRKVYRKTRSIGAAYTPIYTPKGDIAFAGFRRGSIHVYAGNRAKFLNEEWGVSPPEQKQFTRVVATDAKAPKRTAGAKARSPFSTDLFLPAFFYSSNGGFFWTSYWQGSDLLGNHQVGGILSYASGAGFLDYQTQYSFNKFRTKMRAGVAGRLRRGVFNDDSGLTENESSHLQFAGASYPFDRFHRMDLTIASISDNSFFLGINEKIRRESRILSTQFVRDTVRGRYLVATGGNRLRLGYTVSPRVLGGNFVNQTMIVEGVQYIRTGSLNALVLRAFGISQDGPDKTQFILGGIGGVRGYGRSSVRNLGSNGFLTTAEWRVPVLRNLDYYMWYIFPDFYFKAISLSVFTDAGYAWDSRDEYRAMKLKDVRHSYGIGLRLHTFILQLFPFVLHFDYAQRTTSDGGVFYVYIGPLF